MTTPQKPSSYIKRLSEIFISFLLLGLTSFGGPVAHLGYFNQEFIKLKKWASESQYAQWVALSQVIPGPGSSQVGFALGYHRAGLFGGISAFIGFTLPSFIIMVLLAKFSDYWQDNAFFDGVIHALKLLAVVVVADACVSMWHSFCQTITMRVTALLSATFIIFFPSVLSSIIVLVFATALGIAKPSTQINASESLPKVKFGWTMLVFAVIIFALSFMFNSGLSGVFADFYKAGALVFGGGHVVLPMLSAFVSDRVPESSILVGYTTAQAIPGPMFTMASFLGASATPQGQNIWAWAGVATLAVFSSGLLLMLGAQNVWQLLSSSVRFRSAIASLNAAVAGILMASLYHPIATSSLVIWYDLVIVVLGFVWLKFKRISIFWLIALFIVIGLARVFYEKL